MANRKVTIDIVTKANTSGATQAAQALDKLATTANTATAATAATGKGASKAGALFGQAGYQVQDFAVQVGAGTSALTAFAQQAPQLLGAFGPAGAIAGAFVAVGAIAAKVFMSMQDGAMTADEKAKKLADTLAKIGEAAEKAVQDNIDFGKQRIEDSTTAAKQLAEELNTVAENQLSLNQTILDSFAEIQTIENDLKAMRGEKVDSLKQQSEEEKAAAAARQAQTEREIESERLKIKAAEDALAIAKEALVEKEKMKAAEEASLQAGYEALRVAREQLKTAKETAKETMTGSSGAGPGSSLGKTLTPAAIEAKQQIKSGSIVGEIERLKTTVIEMQKSVDNTGELTKEVEAAKREVLAVEGDLRTATEEVNTAIKQIDLESVTNDFGATKKGLEDRAKLLGDEVKSITEGITTKTAEEAAALEVIKTNLSDGQINLDEITTTSAALTQLSTSLRDALSGNTQKITQLITFMAEMKAQSNQLQSRIDAMQSLMKTAMPSR